MKTIFKLSIKLFRRHLKRNLVMMLGISITMFFAISIISVFFSYNDMLIENAYTYGGKWDLKIDANDKMSRVDLLSDPRITHIGQVQTVWTARLDPITESEKEGPSAAFATHWLMALQGCDSNSFDMLQNQLQAGHWPQDDNEIVLPLSFALNGKSIQNGDIKIGDTISFEVGKRIADGGNINHQQQIESPEKFEEVISRTYTVCGILSGYDRSSGVFVSSGVVKTSNFNESSIFLLKTNATTQSELDEITSSIRQDFSLAPEQIAQNEFLANAFLTIEKSDYFQSIAYGGILFIVGLVIVCSGTILNNLLMTVSESSKRIGLLRMVGAQRAHIYSIFIFQSLLTAAGSSLIGVMLSHTAVGTVTKLIGAIKLSEFSDIDITIQPRVVVITVLISFFINVALAFVTAKTTYSLTPVKAFQSGLSVSDYKANNSNLINLVGRVSNSMAVAWRGLARKKLRSIIIVIALIISLSTMTAGFSIGASLWQKSQRELRGFSVDYFVIFSHDSDKSEQLLSILPPVERNTVMYTSNRNIDIPNQYITPEIIEFLGIGNNDLLSSMTICSIDKSLYNFLNPEGKLMPFEDFEKSDGCLIANTAILTSEASAAQLNDEGEVIFTEEPPETEERVVPITTYSIGDSLELFPDFGSEDSIKLPIQGVLSKSHISPVENSVDTIIYISEDLFRKHITEGFHRMMFIDALPGEQDEIGQFLLENKGSFGYYFQDNTLVAGSIKDNNTIQTITILAVITVIVFLCVISIYSIVRTDFYQRRRETALARALGESLSSALKIRLLEDITVLVAAVLISISIFFMLFRLVAQPVLDFYQFNMRVVWIYLLLSSSSLFMILFAHNTYSLAKAFKHKIIEDLSGSY